MGTIGLKEEREGQKRAKRDKKGHQLHHHYGGIEMDFCNWGIQKQDKIKKLKEDNLISCWMASD